MRKKFTPILLTLLCALPLSKAWSQCLPSFSISCSSGDLIDDFWTTGGITNITHMNTGCNGTLPSNTTYFSTMNVTCFPGNSFGVNMQSGSWGQGFRIWIDYNNNNVFTDPGEAVYVSPTSGTGVFSGTVTVPALTSPGTKRMRVLCLYATVPGINDACGTGFSFGEAHDYNLIVANPTPCNQIATGWPSSASTSADKTSICFTDSVEFTFTPNIAIAPASGLSFRWLFSTSSTGPWTQVGTSATPVHKMFASQSGYYKGELMCQTTSLLTSSTPVQIQVNAPTPPSPVQHGFHCGPGIVNLSAAPSPGNDIFWFDQPAGGGAVGQGPTLTTPFLNQSKTFYAASGTGNSKTLQIGTATTSYGGSSYSPGPFSIYYRRTSQQYLYTAAEIIAAGGPMNQINSIKLNCTGLPSYALPNYKISIGTVPAATTTLTWQPTASMTQVFSSASFTPVSGWNTFNFTTPFSWNGADGIVIYICWDQVQPTYDASGDHQYTSASGKGLYTWTDGAGSSCGETGFSTTTYRPNIIFEGMGFCSGPRVPVHANIFEPEATITTTNLPPICQGDSILLSAAGDSSYTYQWMRNGQIVAGAFAQNFYAKVGGNYQVVAMQGNGSCKDTSDTVTVTIYQMPAVGLAYQGPLAFCEGGSIVLRAEAVPFVTYQWFRNGMPIGGATDSFFNASLSGQYQVQTTSPQGCTFKSHTVNVTVYPNPTPPIIRNGLVLSTGVYSTYQWYRNNAPIPGANYQSYSITQPGAYLVEVTTPDGCINRSELMILASLSSKTLAKEDQLKLYPNPTRNQVKVEAPFKVNVSVQNVSGQVLRTIKNAQWIDLTELPSGMYLFVITNEENELVGREKVTKVD